ncbi:MAG: hypothetical protein ACTSXF_11875 [Promethearchaeota archaeon]
MDFLTKYYLLNRIQAIDMALGENSNLVDQNCQYFLAIFSITKKNTKITLYPIKEHILKVFIYAINLPEEKIYNIIAFFSKFKILHTSGVVYIGSDIAYEIYIQGIDMNTQNLRRIINFLISFKEIYNIKFEIIEIKNKI